MKKIYESFVGIATVVFFMFAAMSCSDDKTIDTDQGSGGKKGIAVTGISVTPKSAEMQIGEKLPLAVTITPENATDKSYTWSSSNPAVASVENDVLTAHAAGKLTITATTKDGNFVAICAVSIAINVTGITVSPQTATLGIGEKLTLAATVLPEDATDKTCTWSSSNPAIATVENDVVTGVAPGSAVITATTNDGGLTATCAITVLDSKVAATGAGAYYFGDQYYNGSDNVWVFLTSGNAKEVDKTFEGEGMALLIDLNTTKTGNKVVPAGTYTALLEETSGSQDFTFLPGVDMGAWGVIGSCIYKLDKGSSTPEWIMVEDGQVVVTTSGTNYTVNAQITAGGKQYEFTYTGAINEATGEGGGGDDDKYTTIEMKKLSHGEMDFYGQAYGLPDQNYNNWTIYLADATFDLDAFTGTGEMLMLEINTAKSVTTEITPGTYEVMTVIEPASFVPFSCIPAYPQDGVPMGTWYIKDKTAEYGATSGTVEVSKSGNNYTLDFEFKDDSNPEKPVKFIGSYTGPLKYYDATKAAVPGIKKASMQSGRKAIARPARKAFRK